MYRLAILLLFAVSLLFLNAPTTSAAEPLLIGVAESDVTPPEGFPMAGYYHERLATGTIDPLKAKAVVFRQGDQVAAWAAVDLTGVSRDLCVEVRRKASAKTGIPEQQITISATHSHTGPEYYHRLYEFLAGRESADQSCYPAQLIDGIAAAIVQANEKAQPALVKVGVAQQDVPVSFNRRFVMKDGSVQTWQRLDNPNVVRSAGPIDPEIGLALIESASDQKPMALLSNFALHLDTVGGTKWSADYPYFIEQRVKKELSKNVISVFGTGACGDINHCDPARKERNKTDFIGNSLADSICVALSGLEAIDSPELHVHTATVDLQLQDVTDEQLERAKELIPRAKAGEKVNFFEQVEAVKAVILDELRNKPPHLASPEFIRLGLSHQWGGIGASLPVEVMTVTLGDDLALVFLPGETFVELALSIKQASPYKQTLVVELCNCVEMIYIPTRAACAGGSYEVTNSMVMPGSGEILVETALQLLRESASTE